jgi:thiamine monophosphate synthase
MLLASCSYALLAVVSIGGVKASNAGETVLAGCAGAAVVSDIFGADSPADAARQLLAAVDAALAQRQGQ